MLWAEEFVLINLNPDGTLRSYQRGAIAVGVTGVLLAELAIDGHLDLVGGIRPTSRRPGHPLLAQVLDNTATHEGKQLNVSLGRIKHSGWSEVVDELIAGGLVGHAKPSWRPTRHPIADQVAHESLRAEVRAAALGSAPIGVRMATLLAVTHACRLLWVIAPRRSDRRIAKKRARKGAHETHLDERSQAVIRTMSSAIGTTLKSF